VKHSLIIQVMLCLMISLAATAAKASPLQGNAGAGTTPVAELQPSAAAPSAPAPIQLGTTASNPNELRITGLGGGSDAMDHCNPADIPDPHTIDPHLHDALRTATDCLSLPPAGARPSDNAIQPDPGWLIGDHDLLSDATD
jgi:hypothetical protein